MTGFVWVVVVAIVILPSLAIARPSDCAALERLQAEWAGRKRTPDEKVKEAMMRAWYSANCRKVVRG